MQQPYPQQPYPQQPYPQQYPQPYQQQPYPPQAYPPKPYIPQPSISPSQKKEDKLEWWQKVLIGVAICFLIGIVIIMYTPPVTVSELTQKDEELGTGKGTGTGKAPIAKLPVKFTVQSGQNWDIGKSGQYKCPNAKGVDITGDIGNFANYCIFTGTDAKKNAEAYCTTDPNCLGYVSDGKGKFQLTSRGVISDSTKPSNNFYLKQIGKNNYKLQEGKQWDSSKPNDYTCPKAKGVDTRGTWGSYCIFLGENAPENAMTQCESDSKCTGFFIGGYEGAPMYQLTSKGGATMTDATKSPPNNYFAIDYVSEYGL